MHKIVVLAMPFTPLFELGTPERIFSAAVNQEGEKLYEVKTMSADGASTIATSGMELHMKDTLKGIKDVDTFLILSSDYLLESENRDAITSNIKEIIFEGLKTNPDIRVASICSGAFLLGALGLLENRKVTTHWKLASKLQETFPLARVQSEDLYTQDGSILSSGGVASGIDLCLYMIREDYGTWVANEVARRCIVAPFREGDQRQFTSIVPLGASEESLSAVMQWLLSNIEMQHTVADIAKYMSVSERTVARRFVSEIGLSPIQWLTQARVGKTKELLESTDLSVEQIADAVGLGSAANLRVHFRQCAGVSPQKYRKNFRGSK